MVVAYLQVLSRYSPEMAEENYETGFNWCLVRDWNFVPLDCKSGAANMLEIFVVVCLTTLYHFFWIIRSNEGKIVNDEMGMTKNSVAYFNVLVA